ncbi:hypothetical protein AB0I60_29110 [Actinosynnema sp. NPDC050436]|uniref:hypothetical protein n=1 Tax=Actinosynnema sp. NPDC050436 TaxID=3155659 RepID=UPI00340E12DD
MNEDELKSALHDAMVASSPPPPMSPDAALEAGRNARRRRKAAWGGAVAGLAVVAITVGAVLVPQVTGGAGAGPVLQAGGSGVTPTGLPATTTGTSAPSGTSGSTETPWPDGQTDRTATSGPRAVKSVTLLNELGSSLPPTYQAVDKEAVAEQWAGPMRYAQSQFDSYVDGDRQVWEYLATTPVVQDGAPGVGRLWIQVETRGNRLSTIATPCDAKEATWAIRGACQVVDVGGKQVGLLVRDPAEESEMDELVIYRHPDGTLVSIGQSAEFRRSGHPALDGQVFTREQLAALAVADRFHLD